MCVPRTRLLKRAANAWSIMGMIGICGGSYYLKVTMGYRQTNYNLHDGVSEAVYSPRDWTVVTVAADFTVSSALPIRV